MDSDSSTANKQEREREERAMSTYEAMQSTINVPVAHLVRPPHQIDPALIPLDIGQHFSIELALIERDFATLIYLYPNAEAYGLIGPRIVRNYRLMLNAEKIAYSGCYDIVSLKRHVAFWYQRLYSRVVARQVGYGYLFDSQMADQPDYVRDRPLAYLHYVQGIDEADSLAHRFGLDPLPDLEDLQTYNGWTVLQYRQDESTPHGILALCVDAIPDKPASKWTYYLVTAYAPDHMIETHGLPAALVAPNYRFS